MKKVSKGLIVFIIVLGMMLADMSVGYCATLDITSYGATPSDSSDDTIAIQNAINAASSGDTVYIPNGTYNVSDVINAKTGVRIQGQSQSGAILKFTGSKKKAAVIYIGGKSSIEITQLTINGNNTKYLDAGIKAENSSNIKIDFVTVRDFSYYSREWGPYGVLFRGGDGYISPGVTNSEISDCTMSNMAVASPWSGGIRIAWGSSNNKILRNTITNTGRGGILCNDGCTDLLISNNTVTGSHGEGLGIEVWVGCDRAVIEDNNIDHWLSVDGSKLVAVRRNTVRTTDGTYKYCGLENASQTSDNIFTDNSIGTGQQVGISISNVEVKNYFYFGYNTVQDCVQWGAQVQGDTNYAKYLYFYKCDFSDTRKGDPNAIYPGDDGHGFRVNGNTDYLTCDSCKFNNNNDLGIQLSDINNDHLSFVNGEIMNNIGSAFSYAGAYTAFEAANMIISGNADNSIPAQKSFNNQKPTAVINGPLTGSAGQALSFSSGSSDPDGSIAHVLWDFNDGCPSNSSSQVHTFNTAGTYRVTLIVWDNLGRGAMAEKTVVIN